MRQFVFRVLNIVLIACVLFGYQKQANVRAAQVADYNAQLDEVAQLEAEYAAQTANANFEAYAASVKYGNGTFQGSGEGFGGSIDVEVTIEDFKIVNVEILSHSGEDVAYYSQAADVIPQSVVDKQSADVDCVSGATFSSRGIIQAVKSALEQAVTARPSDDELRSLWENNQ